MDGHVKLKLANDSDIPVVRFIGVNFNGDQFLYDVNAGAHKHVSDVFNGHIGLTAYRVSDQQTLGNDFVSDNQRHGIRRHPSSGFRRSLSAV